MAGARVAFHAPLKPPDHPIASGDREIARLVVKALEQAGCTVELASRFISYQKRPSAELFAEKKRRGEAEAAALLSAFRARPPSERPDAWLTYHPYCKAPDWLGPPISRELGIPYLTVEACRTRQDTDADWMAGREAVRRAIRQAAANFCLKQSDFDYLSAVLDDPASIRPLAPFVDVGAVTAPPLSRRAPGGDPVLLAVGMMRPGKKTQSYRLLAEALRRLPRRDWRLVVIGDGPDLDEVRGYFDFLSPDRLDMPGALPHEQVLAWMRDADIFAWPGYRESIGMVFLEAQANGLPVVALRSLGVPLVVADGSTGILTPEDDAASYAAALARLLDDPALRARMGAEGRRHVLANHGIEAASRTFRTVLDEFGGG